MTDEELEDKFGKDGWKQLPDEVYRRYSFTPAKIEVEEHHVKVYAGKETEEVIKVPHLQTLLRGSLVSKLYPLGSVKKFVFLVKNGSFLVRIQI